MYAGSGRDDVAQLLARFPGPVRLYTSHRKWLGYLALGVGFVALGAWMIRDPASFSDEPMTRGLGHLTALFGLHPNPAAIVAAMSWMTVLFFGFGSVVCLLNLLPGASELTLSAAGFTMSSAYRQKAFNWTDVDRFAATEVRYGIGAKRLVGFDDRCVARSAMARVNVALAGRNSAMLDNYGLAADKLASLMSAWRERALAGRRD